MILDLDHVLLSADKVDVKMLKKLHHYYGHTTPDRLLKFLEKSGKDITDLKAPLLKIEQSCEACIRTKNRKPLRKSATPGGGSKCHSINRFERMETLRSEAIYMLFN